MMPMTFLIHPRWWQYTLQGLLGVIHTHTHTIIGFFKRLTSMPFVAPARTREKMEQDAAHIHEEMVLERALRGARRQQRLLSKEEVKVDKKKKKEERR
ncbi:kinetochore protein Fta7 [Microdochium nivale]|nr:kinetochore protein Fta7 [Microdochium nivale]